jgi:adenosylhomocysteinase
MLANAGHFNAEVNLKALEEMAGEVRRVLRLFVEEFRIAADQRLIVLGEGRLINLAAAEGHPASVMDMSFANQALATGYLVREGRSLEARVYRVPVEIDHEIARLKLTSMGIEIDVLTEEQAAYLRSWESGT